MSSNVLFVCNFPFTTSEDDLRGIFAPYGELQRIRIIQNRDKGQSRGYAFVELEDEERAALATATLNESRFAGRRLVVARARGRGGLNGNGGGNGEHDDDFGNIASLEPSPRNGANGNHGSNGTKLAAHGIYGAPQPKFRQRVELWWSDDDGAWIGSVPALGLRILRSEPELALRAVIDLAAAIPQLPLADLPRQS